MPLNSPHKFQVLILELIISSILYATFYILNLWITTPFTPLNGAHWIFLPAGVALILSLIFPVSGPLGIALIVFPIAYFMRFPGELMISIGIAITAGLAPFISRKIVVDGLKIYPDLSNLSLRRLMASVLIYSIIRAVIHHNWYVYLNLREPNTNGLMVEFIGNVVGIVLVLLTFRWLASRFVGTLNKRQELF